MSAGRVPERPGKQIPLLIGLDSLDAGLGIITPLKRENEFTERKSRPFYALGLGNWVDERRRLSQIAKELSRRKISITTIHCSRFHLFKY